MIKRFVTRPLFTFSLYMVLLLIGIYSYMNLPLDLFPNISIPTLTIITPYPGASPDVIEMTVTKVIEDSVATVNNIDNITSDSLQDVSIITIKFNWGANIDTAASDVRDKLDLVKGTLPDDVMPSTVNKFDISQIPVLTIGITAKESYKTLYHLADKTISNDLKRVDGVGAVLLAGGLQRQINVDIDRERLKSYNISLNQVNAAIQGGNLELPAGTIKSGALEYSIRLPGEYPEVSQIPKLIVGSYLGKDVYLSDIAVVTDDFADPDSIVEVNKKQGLTMMIQKQSGSNSVQVAEGVKEELEKMKATLPPDIEITYISDTSEYIKRSVSDLTSTLFWALLFIFLTVLFFLRNVVGAIIIAAAMPVSMLAAFIFMYLTGATINLISLASIVISIGIVVDDATVVIENIFRHRDQKKEPPKEGSIFGAGEMSSAVLASTTTNLVIFIPLLLVQGFIAIFFNQLSLITIIIIAMSFVTSMSLTPMLASLFLKIHEKKEGNKNALEKFYDWSEARFDALENFYQNVLIWALSHRRMVITGGVLLFVSSMPVFLFTGTEFFPTFDNGQLTANIAMPAGTRIEETYKFMSKLEDRVMKEVKEVIFVEPISGTTSQMSSSKSGHNFGQLYVKVLPIEQRKRSADDIQMQISNIAQSIPGLKSIDFKQSGANSIASSGRPIQVEIYCDDFNISDPIAEKIKEMITPIKGVVQPEISRDKSSPEYELNVDRQKAADLGLSVAEIAMAARGYMYGTKVTKYREGGDQYDIFSRLRLSDRQSYEDIRDCVITTRLGKNIALANVSSIDLGGAPQLIERKNQQRYIIVDADNYGRSTGEITDDIAKQLKKMVLPSGVLTKIAGNTEEMQKSFNSLFIALILGICLIYLVMVAQFESLIDPFIIMFAIPFGVVGLIWALFLTGRPFGVMPFVGIILVTGIAVKNSIVFVDYTNILRKRGLELKEALLQAGKSRLRPILMTSSCTLLGFLPIIMGRGEGSAMWKNMAIGVSGGLLVSLTVTLVFVPTLYYIIETRFRRKKSTEM